MTHFNKTAAALAANAAGANDTLIALIYKGHEQYSPNAMYSGELPSVPFNAIAMSVFFVYCFWQLFLYVKFRNNFYAICTILYLVGQAIGYLGRLLSANDVSNLSLNNENYFLLQFISLTISPNFYNAAIYAEYGRILYTYATTKEKVSRLNVFGKTVQPLLLSLFFIISDITCLVIQAVGGGVEGVSLDNNDPNGLKTGNDIFIAGLATQTFSMSFFALVFTKLCYNIFVRQRLEYVASNDLYEKYNIPRSYSAQKSFFAPWRWYRIINAFPLYETDDHVITIDISHFTNKEKMLFNKYPLAIFSAFGLAVVRCIYRLIELSDGGFSGFLITHEHFLVALDFVPLSLSALIMCFFSQGLVYTANGLKELRLVKKDSYRGLGVWKQLEVEFRYFLHLKVDEEKLDYSHQQKKEAAFADDYSDDYVESTSSNKELV